jgi:hypothetical protein
MFPQFVSFHNSNLHVYRQIVDQARAFRKKRPQGVIGIALIYNLMRWENALSTVGDKYKLRNDFMPFYARLVMVKNPDLKGVFKVKHLFAAP